MKTFLASKLWSNLASLIAKACGLVFFTRYGAHLSASLGWSNTWPSKILLPVWNCNYSAVRCCPVPCGAGDSAEGRVACFTSCLSWMGKSIFWEPLGLVLADHLGSLSCFQVAFHHPLPPAPASDFIAVDKWLAGFVRTCNCRPWGPSLLWLKYRILNEWNVLDLIG